jgi:uncharacterized membrane protein
MIKKNVKKKDVKKKSLETRLAKSPKKVSDINFKLDQIMYMQKRLLKEEHKIEDEETEIEEEEEKTEKGELNENKKLEKIEKEMNSKGQEEEEELLKLKSLEEDIKKEVGEHPLKKIGLKDFIKGLVGAFIGLAVHYTFTYGVEISDGLDMTRATFLFVLAFFVGLMFIYATGFRKIKDPHILMFMPVRLFVLYISAVLMSIFVLYVFYPDFGHDFVHSYKMVAGVLLAAVVGACTADLIGKE